MKRMIDPRKVQEALDRAARSGDRSGRFTLKGRMMPLAESSEAKGELVSKRIRTRLLAGKRNPDGAQP
jgi:hypothetical protein